MDGGEALPQVAVLLVLAILAGTVGHPAQARQRRDRAVDDPDDLAERNRRGGLQERIAAVPAAPALHETMMLQVEKDLVEELLRDAVALGDLADEHRLLAAGFRHGQEGAKSIARLL